MKQPAITETSAWFRSGKIIIMERFQLLFSLWWYVPYSLFKNKTEPQQPTTHN